MDDERRLEALRALQAHLDRLSLVEGRMGRGDLEERDVARLGVSLGPTREQEAFALGVKRGLSLAIAEVRRARTSDPTSETLRDLTAALCRMRGPA